MFSAMLTTGMDLILLILMVLDMNFLGFSVAIENGKV